MRAHLILALAWLPAAVPARAQDTISLPPVVVTGRSDNLIGTAATASEGRVDHIPGALENVVAMGMTWSAAPRGLFASIRLRHFGSYPLIEDNSVRATPTNLVNGDVGYMLGALRVQVSVLNVFNEAAEDITYYYTSRLSGEPAAGVDDIHFHPVEPRQVRVALTWGL